MTDYNKPIVIDYDAKLRESGYEYKGRTEAGQWYRKDGYDVHHSGHMLFFRHDGMTRWFNEDRLEHFTVQDMERQVRIIPNRYTGKEVYLNYDIKYARPV